jgi:O-antigen ligase
MIVVFAARRRTGRARPIQLGVMLALAAGALLLTVYGGGLLDRLGSIDAAADVRTALYSQVLDMIADRPWLGFGAGAFEVAFPPFHELPVSADVIWDKSHSTYLALWAEFGIVFGTLPMLVVAMAFARVLPVALRREHDWAASLAGVGVIAAAAVHSVGDFSFEIEANALLFAAILALGLAGSRPSGPDLGKGSS